MYDQTPGIRPLTDAECDGVSGGLLWLLGLVFAAEVGTYIGAQLYFGGGDGDNALPALGT